MESLNNPVRYLVLDTEGSGLFRYKDEETGEPVPADAPGQPRLASITLLYVEPDMSLSREFQQYVKPDGWEMSEGATAVNKLTTEFLHEKGQPVTLALEEFRKAVVDEGRTVIAYNAQHDLKQIRAELRRAGLPDLFEITKNVCAMRTLHGIVVKESGRGWPKLADACAHFGLPAPDHTSGGDAMACLGLVREMYKRGILQAGQVHYAKRGYEKKKAKNARDVVRKQLQDSVDREDF